MKTNARKSIASSMPMEIIFSAVESARPTRLGAPHLATLPSGEG